jgi:HK97 gp10 family phage protein
MANKVTVTLVGKSIVKQKLRMLDFVAKAQVRDAVNESALNVQRVAKELCPVRKAGKILGGRLRSSIQLEFFNNGMTGEVGTNVEYGPFVEFGTGRRGRQSQHPPLPSSYTHGGRAGMSAQPFLHPAWRREELPFNARIAVAMKTAARRSSS